jgi:hypothetical protein
MGKIGYSEGFDRFWTIRIPSTITARMPVRNTISKTFAPPITAFRVPSIGMDINENR